jgi:hypothetical protein
MLKERHANLVVTKIAEKLEVVRNEKNVKALNSLRKDPQLKELKKLNALEQKARSKRQHVYDKIAKRLNGVAYLNCNGTLSVRNKSTFPSKSEISAIKMDVIQAILRGKATDIDTLINKIVSQRS